MVRKTGCFKGSDVQLTKGHCLNSEELKRKKVFVTVSHCSPRVSPWLQLGIATTSSCSHFLSNLCEVLDQDLYVGETDLK